MEIDPNTYTIKEIDEAIAKLHEKLSKPNKWKLLSERCKFFLWIILSCAFLTRWIWLLEMERWKELIKFTLLMGVGFTIGISEIPSAISWKFKRLFKEKRYD